MNEMHGTMNVKTAQHVLGHPHAHHQELISCSIRLWFTVGNVVVAMLLVVVGSVSCFI
jgi:hypothetical protein